MKNETIVPKTVRGKAPARAGRTSTNNAVLWDRRIKEYRLWSMGVSKTEIARQFGIAVPTVLDDLDAVAMLEPVTNIKRKIDAHLSEVVRTCFEKVSQEDTPHNAKVGYIHEINEAASRLSRIHGLEKESNQIFLNQTINNLTGAENHYVKWSNDKLAEEFRRRRLQTSTGNSK